MESKKYPQTEYSKRYHKKHGIVCKRFDLDADTAALLARLVEQRGESQIAVFRAALQALAEKEA